MPYAFCGLGILKVHCLPWPFPREHFWQPRGRGLTLQWSSLGECGTRCQVRPAVLETRPGLCGGLFVQTGPRTGLGSSLAAGRHSCWKGHSNATSRRAPSCWDQQEAGSQVLNCFLAERDWKSSPCGDSASYRHVWAVEWRNSPSLRD